MRIQPLDPCVLDRLSPTAPAAELRRTLHVGGYFADPPAGTEAASTFAALHTELAALDAAEARLNVLVHPHVWITGEVPVSVRWGLVAVAAVLAIIGGATTGLGTIFALFGTPLVLTPLALAGLVALLWMESRRRSLFAEMDRRRLGHGQSVVRHAGWLARHTFVLDHAGVRVLSAPHLTWVVHRLRDLRVHRTPEAPPERDTFAAALGAERERLEAVAARTEPPPTAAELEIDLPRWAAEFAAWKVPPDRTGQGAWLDRALAGPSPGP